MLQTLVEVCKIMQNVKDDRLDVCEVLAFGFNLFSSAQRVSANANDDGSYTNPRIRATRDFFHYEPGPADPMPTPQRLGVFASQGEGMDEYLRGHAMEVANKAVGILRSIGNKVKANTGGDSGPDAGEDPAGTVLRCMAVQVVSDPALDHN